MLLIANCLRLSGHFQAVAENRRKTHRTITPHNQQHVKKDETCVIPQKTLTSPTISLGISKQ
jgi:hypothetical protein